ncbi:MAG: hypothetical protein ACPGVO_10850 [Spirulinaceae cyanobacterium]
MEYFKHLIAKPNTIFTTLHNGLSIRWKALLAILMVVIVFGLLFVFYGYEPTWRLWNIPVMSPNFADLRGITHGADSFAQGFDPLIHNPSDLWNRPLNYPRIWHLLYWTGLNKSHTVGLAVGVIFAFLAGVVIILPNVSNVTVSLVILALVSPAVLLGIERANIDLLMFFIVALTIGFAQRSAVLADIGILLGTALKIFPFFGISLLVRLRKQQFIQHACIILCLSSLYVAINWSELNLISQSTPRETYLSYGMNVLWLGVSQNISPLLGKIIYLLSLASIAAIFLLIFFTLVQPSRFGLANQELHFNDGTLSLDAFRVGTSIYLGTFLIGNNWDYRLSFLIFVIPQLSLWLNSSSRRLRWCSSATLLATFVSMWYLGLSGVWDALLSKFPFVLPGAALYPWFLNELSNWLLFGLLSYLFTLTLPPWFKGWVASPFHQN